MGTVAWRVRAQVRLALGRRKWGLLLRGEERKGELKIYAEKKGRLLGKLRDPELVDTENALLKNSGICEVRCPRAQGWTGLAGGWARR